MKIILSPAKQMIKDTDSLQGESTPAFAQDAKQLCAALLALDPSALKKLWGCSEKLAGESLAMMEAMRFEGVQTPAILAYNGIAYKYMQPGVFEAGEFDYLREHLRILSGLYGVLRPMDGVEPYRLEMQAKLSVNGAKDLYAYWGSRLYEAVRDESRWIVNLASKEYSRCIEAYLTPEDRYLSCTFGEAEGGKIVQKGVYAKMARGEMVRYMAVNRVEEPEALKGFDRLGYAFSMEHSDEKNYVFIKG